MEHSRRGRRASSRYESLTESMPRVLIDIAMHTAPASANLLIRLGETNSFVPPSLIHVRGNKLRRLIVPIPGSSLNSSVTHDENGNNRCSLWDIGVTGVLGHPRSGILSRWCLCSDCLALGGTKGKGHEGILVGKLKELMNLSPRAAEFIYTNGCNRKTRCLFESGPFRCLVIKK